MMRTKDSTENFTENFLRRKHCCFLLSKLAMNSNLVVHIHTLVSLFFIKAFLTITVI